MSNFFDALTDSDGVITVLLNRVLFRQTPRQRVISRAERQQQRVQDERYKQLLHAHRTDQLPPTRSYTSLAPSDSYRVR